MATQLSAAPPAGPSALEAKDRPNDTGQAIELKWQLSPDDSPARTPRVVRGYEIVRTLGDGSDEDVVGKVPYGVSDFTDQQCRPGQEYLYSIFALGAEGERSDPAKLAAPVQAKLQWFDRRRAGFGAIVLYVCLAVVLFTILARRGWPMRVREIAALRAMEEAVGRATEMGRPCLFIPGILDMNEIATVAGVNVLSRVAQVVAEYDGSIVVPTARSLVMTAARETVEASCLAAGRPEAYDENSIYYVTDEQFAYVAHVTGFMVREKPAACFYMGVFYAESLILAETGSSVGALQIGGTSEPPQLPFFVAACDYTLIGEELFAASAYLSGEPDQFGSLKGQDSGKLLAGALLLTGCVLATWASLAPQSSLAADALSFVTNTILGRG